MKKVVAFANPFVLSGFMTEGIDACAVMIQSSISEVVVAVYILPFPISDFIRYILELTQTTYTAVKCDRSLLSHSSTMLYPPVSLSCSLMSNRFRSSAAKYF